LSAFSELAKKLSFAQKQAGYPRIVVWQSSTYDGAGAQRLIQVMGQVRSVWHGPASVMSATGAKDEQISAAELDSGISAALGCVELAKDRRIK
jgi:hypothetical protein